MKNAIIDLFCGCGGLSLGFEMAGFSPCYAIDFWNDAVNTFNHNNPAQVAHCEDIKNLSNEKLKDILEKHDVVGVVGGPPCQGFSTVGRRDINDPRNQLYLEYCRVVETVKPLFFVLENVKGLTTLSGGAFKDDIIKRFSALGYRVQFQILNSANYGVPQNRQRVFFVGTLQHAFAFPAPSEHLIGCREALSDLPPLSISEEDVEDIQYATSPQNNFQKAMRGKQRSVKNHQITRHSDQTRQIIHLIPDGGKISDLPPEYWDVRKYNKAFERMSSTRPSNTVDTGHRNYFHYCEDRIPTARENARLQSFPDSFVFLGSRTSQYKQIGNAVPPLLAYAVAQAIKQQLSLGE